jgi:threonine dehydratase
VLDVVEDVVGVPEAEILARIAFAWEHLRLAIEPAAAVALAALEARTRELAGLRVAVVLSGGNVEPALLARALRDTPWR